eukprot:5691822-Amphidinium_carterae.1
MEIVIVLVIYLIPESSKIACTALCLNSMRTAISDTSADNSQRKTLNIRGPCNPKALSLGLRPYSPETTMTETKIRR